MCYQAFDTLMNAFGQQSTPGGTVTFQDIPESSPLFCTWETKHRDEWSLRGCIGSLSPNQLTADYISHYALASAFLDRRFYPISFYEVNELRVSISLLVNYEPCEHVYDWEVGKHGIILQFSAEGRSYEATLLPEYVWSDQEQVVQFLIGKAGFSGIVTSDLLNEITCTRYQSSKC